MRHNCLFLSLQSLAEALSDCNRLNGVTAAFKHKSTEASIPDSASSQNKKGNRNRFIDPQTQKVLKFKVQKNILEPPQQSDVILPGHSYQSYQYIYCCERVVPAWLFLIYKELIKNNYRRLSLMLRPT